MSYGRVRLVWCGVAVCLLAVASGTTADAVLTMEAFPSPGPNVSASPNWAGYLGNALNSMENGLGNIGDPSTDPAAYRTIDTAPNGGEFIVTSVPSWLGQLDPGTAFGPAFASEYGNRLHFGLHILGNGTQFRLEDLTFNMSSTDPFNFVGFAGDFVGLSYASHRVGIDYVDGIKGNGDDVTYNAGQSGTLLVDELIYVGVGLATDGTHPGWGGSNDAENLANALDYILSNRPWDIIGRYTQYASDGVTVLGSTYNVVSVPEPASVSLVAVGLGAWFIRRRSQS